MTTLLLTIMASGALDVLEKIYIQSINNPKCIPINTICIINLSSWPHTLKAQREPWQRIDINRITHFGGSTINKIKRRNNRIKMVKWGTTFTC